MSLSFLTELSLVGPVRALLGSLSNPAETATDITSDRTKLIATVAANYDSLKEVAEPHIRVFKEYNKQLAAFANGRRPDKPKKPKFDVQLPTFLSFIRSPFCVSFRIDGFDGGEAVAGWTSTPPLESPAAHRPGCPVGPAGVVSERTS